MRMQFMQKFMQFDYIYICVNQDQHSSYECFNTEELMRVHWEKCLKILLSDGYHMLVLPDSTKEPARKVKLPVALAGESLWEGHDGATHTHALDRGPKASC